MKPIDLSSVSLKILGIYSFMQSIPMIKVLFDTRNMANLKAFDPALSYWIASLGAIVAIVLYIALGIFLLFFSDKIAHKIAEDKEDKNDIKSVQTLNSKNIQAIAISVVGLLIMALAIPKIFQFTVNLSAIKTPGIDPYLVKKLSIDTKAFGIQIGAQFLMGLLLFIGGSSISAFWNKFLNRLNYEKGLK